MRNSRRKKVFCIFLTIIIGFSVSFTFFSSLFINSLPKNTFYLDNPNRSAGEIIITTPEDRSYTEPDNGYYPALYGFENESHGSNPIGFNIHEGAGYVNVIDSKEEHAKVVEMYDATSGDHTELHQVFQPQTYGSVEFWILDDDVSDTFSIRLLDSTATSVWGNGIGWIQIWQDTLRYLGDSDWQVTSKVISDDTWYHFKVEFECTSGNYQGLAQGTWRFYVDGELFGDFSFLNDISNITQIYFAQRGSDNNYRCYVDAIGYSWDFAYTIGDNINEGLLLSYENAIALDWQGYTLDRQANKTILGHITIPMPDNGDHIIQIFGNNSLGTMYQSDLRHFTISEPSINIITPENKTYTTPDSGFYPATFGFENDALGLTPDGWYVRTAGSGYYEVDETLNGHNNVYEIRKSGGVNKVETYRILSTSATVGTVEFWLYKDTDSSIDPTRITLRDDPTGGYIPFGFENGDLFIGAWSEKSHIFNNAFTKNEWHHIRVDFDLTVGWQVKIDDTWYGEGFAFTSYASDHSDPTKIDTFHVESIYSGDNPSYGAWFDAIGYSWASDYNIGDNLNEGLLLSYDNRTYLDWKGYALDGQLNRTILGNTTFPMPADGLHTIQMFGSNSTGFMYESNIRYFTVNTASYPYLEIITPEARTYFEPMAGYYPATHGFENEIGGTSGTAIEYVDVTTISSGCEVQIYDEYQGHKKVLRLHDGNTAGNARAQHNFSSTHTSGYVEWWWNTPVSGSSGMAYHFHEGSLGTHAGTVVMKDGNFLDMEGNIIQSYVANRWYHHKIAFDTIWDQYDWYIDGILVVNDGNFENHVTNIGSTNIKGGWTSTGSCYIDAVGFSWDPGYFIGDNYKEGLLLSYLNNTNFDWIGYSLDGSSNITIMGNMIIPLPENGIHSIVLNGITSTGTSTQSDVRYFTIDYQEPPPPPIPPIIPEPLNLIPTLLNSMGFGIIALLGITLFLFIKHNRTRTRT